MEEDIKNRIILILSVIAIILFISLIGSCSSAHKNKTARDKEMATRLDLEEMVNKFTQEKSSLEKQISNLKEDLQAAKSAEEAATKELTQEQLVNQSLTEEMQKIIKLKEALEDELKDALVANKSKSPSGQTQK
jgi:predicted RNase H-like nuclease (RuvC/YqgF family)